MSEEIKNHGKSIRARLLNVAKQENIFFQTILTRYYQRYAHIAGVDDYWIHQIKEEINDRIEILSEM